MRVRAPETITVGHDSWVPAGTAAYPVNLPAGSRAVLSTATEMLARVDAPDTDATMHLVSARPLIEGETVRLTVSADHAVTYRVELPVASAPTSTDDATPVATRVAGNWPSL